MGFVWLGVWVRAAELVEVGVMLEMQDLADWKPVVRVAMADSKQEDRLATAESTPVDRVATAESTPVDRAATVDSKQVGRVAATDLVPTPNSATSMGHR